MTRFSPLQRSACLRFFGTLASLAESNSDRVQLDHDIRIESDERVGDVTCIGCSVYVRGQVPATLPLSPEAYSPSQGASIAGDVTAIGGNARVESGAQVAGDLTAIGGTLRRDPRPA